MERVLRVIFSGRSLHFLKVFFFDFSKIKRKSKFSTRQDFLFSGKFIDCLHFRDLRYLFFQCRSSARTIVFVGIWHLPHDTPSLVLYFRRNELNVTGTVVLDILTFTIPSATPSNSISPPSAWRLFRKSARISSTDSFRSIKSLSFLVNIYFPYHSDVAKSLYSQHFLPAILKFAPSISYSNHGVGFDDRPIILIKFLSSTDSISMIPSNSCFIVANVCSSCMPLSIRYIPRLPVDFMRPVKTWRNLKTVWIFEYIKIVEIEFMWSWFFRIFFLVMNSSKK